MKWKSVKEEPPKKDGRYFLLVDMDQPCISNDSIVRVQIPMVGNYREADDGWVGVYPLMEITHWMEIPPLEA